MAYGQTERISPALIGGVMVLSLVLGGLGGYYFGYNTGYDAGAKAILEENTRAKILDAVRRFAADFVALSGLPLAPQIPDYVMIERIFDVSLQSGLLIDATLLPSPPAKFDIRRLARIFDDLKVPFKMQESFKDALREELLRTVRAGDYVVPIEWRFNTTMGPRSERSLSIVDGQRFWVKYDTFARFVPVPYRSSPQHASTLSAAHELAAGPPVTLEKPLLSFFGSPIVTARSTITPDWGVLAREVEWVTVRLSISFSSRFDGNEFLAYYYSVTSKVGVALGTPRKALSDREKIFDAGALDSLIILSSEKGRFGNMLSFDVFDRNDIATPSHILFKAIMRLIRFPEAAAYDPKDDRITFETIADTPTLLRLKNIPRPDRPFFNGIGASFSVEIRLAATPNSSVRLETTLILVTDWNYVPLDSKPLIFSLQL
jgi:hypothetical protein